jgi:hypothetical protein
MPYIKQENRNQFNSLMKELNNTKINSPGELNYLFTMVLQQYMVDRPISYQTFNDILGALEGAKLELYRSLVSKYEDLKKDEHGDVYK